MAQICISATIYKAFFLQLIYRIYQLLFFVFKTTALLCFFLSLPILPNLNPLFFMQTSTRHTIRISPILFDMSCKSILVAYCHLSIGPYIFFLVFFFFNNLCFGSCH
ncbi:hypothetical protein CLU79DRAFT_253756 [Phycomyces nitens]|nr:hypothetical protein CLU79DRAFT_253756 [Phycomyces nitens]